ncbi:hypothetical protein EYC80_002546 [Monilinia laxa]|uniref:2EXR domain-containing protein n=1 Tax=Monilinia laxa TaxID=61186 RepID=A0A5N6K469_MONLA|nr:hypothetical protein EYC80_002546 [Monilinia laxa]
MDPIEEILLQQVRDKYSQKIEPTNTITMALASPLQTSLSPTLASTLTSAFALTLTTTRARTLTKTLSTAGHDSEIILINNKPEQQQQQQQQDFPQYSKFPLEIQRKIWVYSLPGPRVTAIKYDDQNNVCESTSSIPVALHVCNVSRTEALRFYSLSFGTTVDNGHIYFSFGFDIPLLLTNIFNNAGSSTLPVKELESFINSTWDLEKLDTVAMIPGLIKSFFWSPSKTTPKSLPRDH